MIIGNVQVNHMALCKRLGFSFIEICKNLIVHSLFAAQDDVEDVFVFLELLRMAFDFPVSIEHVQHSILTVNVSILGMFFNEMKIFNMLLSDKMCVVKFACLCR